MLLLFSLTLFLSAALLFVVEPMFAKMVLPLLGSTPAVWNTAVLFFQAALLGGYAYAHGSVGWLGARRQAAVHAAVLLTPLLVLPIGIPIGWIPPAAGSPVGWLLLVLLVGVGLPFFVVATMSPLLQRWFAATGHRRAVDPYFLYRASNLGSAVGLVGYPLLLEPTLRLAQQARVWAFSYLGLLALGLVCSVAMWRSAEDPAPGSPAGVSAPAASGAVRAEAEGAAGHPISALRRARWVILAFAPASLMLGVTSYLTTNLAPIPLLWVIPLALYLLSFVVAFSPGAGSTQRLAARVLPLLLLPTALTIVLEGGRPLWLLGLLHLTTFFVAAVVAHGRLAGDRPPAAKLTEFYLWIATGGVLGGLFNALLAPVVFNSFAEYPLVLVLAAALRPKASPRGDTGPARLLDVALPAALGGSVLGLAALVQAAGVEDLLVRRALLVGLPALACVLFLGRPTRFALGVGALLLASSLPVAGRPEVVYASRTFFGVNRVQRDNDGRFHVLLSGTTVHGMQDLTPARRDEPLTYYTREGPLGQVFQAFDSSNASRSVAVVGLGTGSMACYARPGERWTFYELDPEVVRIAADPRLFTFLRDCLPGQAAVVGDGRLSLERARGRRYGLIAVDAFNSDFIPVHLLTREAVHVYLSHLDEGGILAFHISNNYVDLHPVLANLANAAGLVSFGRDEDQVGPGRAEQGAFPSDWVVVARQTKDLGSLVDDPRWRPLRPRPDFPVWTDDFSNVLSVLRLD